MVFLGQHSIADVMGTGSDGDEWAAGDFRDDAAADGNDAGHDVDGDVDDSDDDDDDDGHVDNDVVEGDLEQTAATRIHMQQR